jgi:thioredoxin-related protein
VTRVAVALAVAAVVALVAVWLQRRRPSGPAPTRHHVPTVVARADFARPEATWLVVVFTSATCSTCAETWEAARALASDTVAVEEAEVSARPDLHERYGIDAVPTTIVADATGAVRASFLGPASPDHLRNCVSW